MRNYKYPIIVICMSLIFSACKRLDILPLGEISDSQVWSDMSLMRATAYNAYANMGSPYLSTFPLSLFCDEAFSTVGGSEYNWTRGLVEADNPSRMDGAPQFSWTSNFSGIRKCNTFLQNTESYEGPYVAEVQTLRGEILFLRAYIFHNLLRMFGGFPILTRPVTITDDMNLPRNTYEECVNAIIKDCDEAAAALPLDAIAGHATKGAALALKARVLLYAASDLANNNTWATALGSANPELVGFIGGDRTARWTAARDAAKAVIDLGIYSLYKQDPAPGDSITMNLRNIFLDYNNSEIIMAAQYTETYPQEGSFLFAPNGWGGWGTAAPTQNFVDLFEMTDGTKFSWSNPAQAADPYANRDPRLPASIWYNGMKYRPRPDITSGFDPIGIVETALNYEYWNPGTHQVETRPGLDTRSGPLYPWCGTYTGYFTHKGVREDIDPLGAKPTQTVPIVYFRYAEVLLNYAEACIALGGANETIGRDALNQIRKRAGMPAIPNDETGATLMSRCQNERSVELCFEEHRFFDIRRWMIAPAIFSVNCQGVDITAKLNPDHETHTFIYTPGLFVGEYRWADKTYYAPIYRSEMQKSSAFIQNPGYN